MIEYGREWKANLFGFLDRCGFELLIDVEINSRGHAPETTKILDSLAQGDRPGSDRPRRLRSGTVIVREYQGERHTVTVVPGGYVWRDATYASLSAIASPPSLGSNKHHLASKREYPSGGP